MSYNFIGTFHCSSYQPQYAFVTSSRIREKKKKKWCQLVLLPFGIVSPVPHGIFIACFIHSCICSLIESMHVVNVLAHATCISAVLWYLFCKLLWRYECPWRLHTQQSVHSTTLIPLEWTAFIACLRWRKACASKWHVSLARHSLHLSRQIILTLHLWNYLTFETFICWWVTFYKLPFFAQCLSKSPQFLSSCSGCIFCEQSLQ